MAMVFQDPMTSLNPVHSIGRQLIGGGPPAPGRLEAAGARASGRGAEGGRYSARRAPDRRLSAPVLRRHAAAGDDRDGAGERPRSPHRRRADDGARRDHAGADPRPDGHAAGGIREGDHHDHPRPRRRRRDRGRRRRNVCGRGRRAGARGRLFSRPQHPYTWGLLGSLPRLDRRSSDSSRSRSATLAAEPAERLPLPPALSVRDGHLSHDRARSRPGRRRLRRGPPRRVPSAIRRPGSARAQGFSPVWRRADGGGAPRRRGPEEALPGHARDHLPEGGRRGEGGGRGELHRQAGARPSASSANPAAESRRWRAASCGCSIPRPAGSSSTARTSHSCPGRRCDRSGAR